MNQTVFSQELILKYELWKVSQEIVPFEFLSSRRNPIEKIFFWNKFSIPLCHQWKLHIQVGPIPWNMRIALHFSYQFANFISVCNSHFLVYGSYVDVCNFHMFCNFHMSLQFSYQFAILTLQLQHFLCGFTTWNPCHYELELIKATSATVPRGRDIEK